MSEVRSDAEMRAEAARRGCIVVEPAPNELFIDIDGPADLARHQAALTIFRQLHNVVEVRMRPSPSGAPYHYHVIVTLEKPVPSDEVRIYWQALLGSDAQREALSLLRLDGDRPPTVFFERIGMANAEIIDAPAGKNWPW